MLSSKFFAAVQRMVRQENPFRVASTGLAPAGDPMVEAPIAGAQNVKTPSVETPVSDTAIQIEAGEKPGLWVLSWDEVPSSGGYELQVSNDSKVFDPWTGRTRHNKAKAVLTVPVGAPPVWARVRVIGIKGPGAWSRPVAVGEAGEAGDAMDRAA